eukprot:PhF_6_TR29232/c0_g1_i1/m.42782
MFAGFDLDHLSFVPSESNNTAMIDGTIAPPRNVTYNSSSDDEFNKEYIDPASPTTQDLSFLPVRKPNKRYCTKSEKKPWTPRDVPLHDDYDTVRGARPPMEPVIDVYEPQGSYINFTDSGYERKPEYHFTTNPTDIMETDIYDLSASEDERRDAEDQRRTREKRAREVADEKTETHDEKDDDQDEEQEEEEEDEEEDEDEEAVQLIQQLIQHAEESPDVSSSCEGEIRVLKELVLRFEVGDITSLDDLHQHVTPLFAVIQAKIQQSDI